MRDRGRPVRPVAHGRAVGRGPGRRGRPGGRARDGPAHARRGPRALLDDLRAGRRHHRRPDRLPHRARSGSSSSPTRRNAPVVAAELRERLAGSTRPGGRHRCAPRCVAIQGPGARDILAPADGRGPGGARATTRSRAGPAAGVPAHVARTGYTGEDGFELFVAWEDGAVVWERAARRRRGRRPGARAASAPATRCAWRRACRSTATSSTRRPRPSRRGWGGWCSSTRRRLRGAPRAGGRRAGAPQAARRARAARPRHRAPRLPGASAGGGGGLRGA